MLQPDDSGLRRMRSFVHNSHPGRVIFGAGTLTTALPGEVERLGCEHLLILSTPGHEALARTIAERLGVGERNVFAGARMHTPVAVTDQALAVAAQLHADGLVSMLVDALNHERPEGSTENTVLGPFHVAPHTAGHPHLQRRIIADHHGLAENGGRVSDDGRVIHRS